MPSGEELYSGNSTLKEMPLVDITHFIDRKQESLTINDFLLAKGFAGLGNMVLTSHTGV